jgi:sec-independent protein translocase protein TatB
MFGIDFSEILLIFGIALVVLGPEKLPKLANTIGKWIGRARGMARQFREQLEQESQTLHKSVDLSQEFSSRPGAQPGNGGPVPRPTADSSTAPAGPEPRIDPRPVGPPAPMTGSPLPEMGLADTYPAAFHPYQPPSIAEPLPAAAPATAVSPAHSTTGAADTSANGSAAAAGAADSSGTAGLAGAQDPSFPAPHQTAFWPPDGRL